MERASNRRAVVVGGSIGGLLAARALSNHFEQVVVLERDRVGDGPETRKGQPHTRHAHGLLASGYQQLQAMFPGLDAALAADGALVADIGRAVSWYQFGAWKQAHDSGLEACFVSRPLLEWHVRRRVLALGNVSQYSEHAVIGLEASADRRRVTGVRVRDAAGVEEPWQADLVVDASGRAGSTSRRLEALGYERPAESRVTVGIAYATRVYRRPAHMNGAGSCVLVPLCAPGQRGAVLLPIEGDRWVLTASGIHGEVPPCDELGFTRFIRELAVPTVADALSGCEPLSPIIPYRFPFSLRRHYEKLRRFPAGLLVLGDGVASFNPVFGQGMSVAALEAAALDRLLASRGCTPDLWRAYFARVARIVDIPWQIAVAEDFRWAQTQGEKPLGTDYVNAYLARLHVMMAHDTEVYGQFIRVANLLAEPTSLFRPRWLWSALHTPPAPVLTPALETAE